MLENHYTPQNDRKTRECKHDTKKSHPDKLLDSFEKITIELAGLHFLWSLVHGTFITSDDFCGV